MQRLAFNLLALTSKFKSQPQLYALINDSSGVVVFNLYVVLHGMSHVQLISILEFVYLNFHNH